MKWHQRMFARMYKRASSTESLAWHRDNPVPLLKTAVAQRPSTGRALDLGCGTGVDAVYLAQQGYDVTAVDFVADALAATQRRGASASVPVDCREGDVIDIDVSGPFDIVLDSGCLHHIPRGTSGAQNGPYGLRSLLRAFRSRLAVTRRFETTINTTVWP